MKRFTAFSIILALFSMILTGCQDYAEGPSISFRSAEERAVNNWQVEYAFEEELDISKRYEDITYDLDYEGFLKIYTRVDSDSVAIQKGFWKFFEDESKIRFLYTDPPVWPDRASYEILRLTEKEMWIQELENPLTLEIRLMPSDSADAE